LCVESDSTFAVLDDVVREIAGLTPGPYFHIGGDEVVGLAPEAYNRFIERVQELVSRHGKRTIGWEEITKARLAPTTVVQQWKSDSATAGLRYGVKFVMSPAQKAYLDMKYTPATELGLTWAAFIELRTAYDWNPTAYLPGVGEREVLGVEAPLWGETIDNIGAAEYLALPRLPALAEVAWSPQAARDWSSFRTRVAAQAQRWRYLGFNYYRSPQVDW
jgi:hexosaminidase